MPEKLSLGIVKETREGERRVAASPNVVARWKKSGFDVCIERGAGELSSYPDEQFEAAGAVLVDRADAWKADIVLKLRPPVMRVWLECYEPAHGQVVDDSLHILPMGA